MNVAQFCTVVCHSAFRTTSMAAALTMKNVWKGSAAAEHGRPAAAERGTNIAFANMDWNSARHTGKKQKALASSRRAVSETNYFDCTHLLPERRQTMFQAYLEHVDSTGLRPGQQPKRKKSDAEAHRGTSLTTR